MIATQRAIAVAEIGTAHGGNLQKGLELIDAAADSGADAVKVQVVFAREILPPEAGLVPLPGGLKPLYEIFRSLEQPSEFYAALAERAQHRGIDFFGTPFGTESMQILSKIGVHTWKLASPELNHEPLLEKLAQTEQTLILSTGVSLARDIERALQLIRSVRSSTAPIILLHCRSLYPLPENQANLYSIPLMSKQFNLPVGFSDHSTDPILLPSLAIALGAVMVEKHLTLDNDAGGLDDSIALNPEKFALMTRAMRRFGGEGRSHTSTDAKKTLKHAIDELSPEYGLERIVNALGDNSLGMAPDEEIHYHRTNRSIHAIGALPKDTILTPENTAILRTEKCLRPGIKPKHRRKVYGRRLCRDISSGDGITWDDLEAMPS